MQLLHTNKLCIYMRFWKLHAYCIVKRVYGTCLWVCKEPIYIWCSERHEYCTHRLLAGSQSVRILPTISFVLYSFNKVSYSCVPLTVVSLYAREERYPPTSTQQWVRAIPISWNFYVSIHILRAKQFNVVIGRCMYV